MYVCLELRGVFADPWIAHQTGLPPHNFAINPSDTDKTWMERLRYLKPLHSFRGGFTYSNVNFAAAGYIVEVLTGRSYYDILDEYIFDPLGMDAGSDYTQLKADGAEISQGWIRQDVNYTRCAVEAAELAAASANATDGTTPAGSDADAEAGAEAPSREELLAASGLPLSCLGTPEGMEFWTDGPGQEWGAGGNVIATGNALVSTPSPSHRTSICIRVVILTSLLQVKWMKEVLNPSHIPLAVHERVEEPPVANEEGTGYAMGTIRAPYRGYVASTHDGALPGSNSNTMRIRNESVGVFTLSTDDGYASLWYNIALPAVLDDLLDLPPVEAAADNSTGGAEGASDTASNPLEGLPVRVPPPADARPPPDTAQWVGSTYEAPGYAPFTLSSIDLSDFEATEAAEIPIDFLTIDAATLGEIPLPIEGEVLYAKWDQTVAQYLFLTPFDGPIYNVTIISSWSRLGPDYSSLVNASADGNSTDAATVTTDTAYIGKFWGAPTAVLGEDGIGFFNGFWASQGVEGNVQAVEEGIADAAEVFFARQQ